MRSWFGVLRIGFPAMESASARCPSPRKKTRLGRFDFLWAAANAGATVETAAVPAIASDACRKSRRVVVPCAGVTDLGLCSFASDIKLLSFICRVCLERELQLESDVARIECRSDLSEGCSTYGCSDAIEGRMIEEVEKLAFELRRNGSITDEMEGRFLG